MSQDKCPYDIDQTNSQESRGLRFVKKTEISWMVRNTKRKR